MTAMHWAILIVIILAVLWLLGAFAGLGLSSPLS